jgi:radical SAM protein with 4Fe4S-binding SPASM domain
MMMVRRKKKINIIIQRKKKKEEEIDREGSWFDRLNGRRQRTHVVCDGCGVIFYCFGGCQQSSSVHVSVTNKTDEINLIFCVRD